jgi:diketogulonate reductase-like aldo/keto reductase
VNVIPKRVTPARIKENFDAESVELNAEQVARLKALNVGFRTFTGIDVFGYDSHL